MAISRAELFHVIEGMQCVLYVSGTYKQADLYHRASEVYAKHGSGYVRLEARGGTSAPKIRWIDCDVGGEGGNGPLLTASLTDDSWARPSYSGGAR